MADMVALVKKALGYAAQENLGLAPDCAWCWSCRSRHESSPNYSMTPQLRLTQRS